MSLTTEYLKKVLQPVNKLHMVIEMNKNFPCVPYYSELQKRKAEKILKKNGELEIAASHLIESHGVGLRHTAINVEREKLKRKNSKNSTSFTNAEEMLHGKFLNFGKLLTPTSLNSPNEWTVVQISEVWSSLENLSMLGFGPPPSICNLPDLMITRITGQTPSRVTVKYVPRPASNSGCGSLLAELKSILDGNRAVNKDFRGSREEYWRMRQEHHDQLKQVVDTLENWWLDHLKFFLLGEPNDPLDSDLLNQLVTGAMEALRKIRKSPSLNEQYSLRLLISAYPFLNSHQIIRGLMGIFEVVAKSELVTELLGYFRTVQTGLQQLKNAKRKPIFLILDKNIQQFPWESMAFLSATPVSRLPSLHFLNFLSQKHFSEPPKSRKLLPKPERQLLSNMIVVNPKLAYYVLNPGQDLPGIQERMQPIVESVWGKDCGLSGAEPMEQQIKQSLVERDLFLYCGHGSGSKYLPNDHLLKLDCKATPILMGCSSGQLSSPGRIVDPTGAAACYLMAGSPGVVGFLWEVTDLDSDRFTIRLLDLIVGARKQQSRPKISKKTGKAVELPPPPEELEPEILRAVSASRPVTKNFLTGAAAVVYGLPIRAIDFE